MHSRLVTVSIVGLLLLFSLPFFASTNASAQTEPDVTLTLHNDILEADISQGEHGTVTFRGIARCSSDEPDQTFKTISVTLMATADLDLDYSINPKEFTLHPEDSPSTEFSVTFTIPSDTRADVIFGFSVFGTAKYLAGNKIYNIPIVNGNITVKPYLRFGVSSDAIEDAYPGEDVFSGLTISNYGNFDEEFRISISKTTIPNVEDWDLTISNPTINIPQYGYTTIFVNAKVPENADKGAYLITFNVTPSGMNGTLETKSYQATMYINVVSRISSDGDYALFSILAGVILLVIIIAVIVMIRNRRKKVD